MKISRRSIPVLAVWLLAFPGSLQAFGGSKDKVMTLALDLEEHRRSAAQLPQPFSPPASEEQESKFHLSGYYKNLYSTSKTLDTQEGISGDLNRLRLDGKVDITPQWMARVIFDQTVFYNDFAQTSAFDIIKGKSQRQLQFINTEAVYNDKKHLYTASGLYRAYVKYDNSTWQLTAGKQAIDWGRTRFWSPLDLFNQVSPLEIERDERAGVDAMSAEFPLASSLSANIVYAPQSSFDRSSVGGRLSTHWGDFDVYAVGGVFQDNKTAGAGFDGSLGGTEVRGEFSQTHSSDGRNFFRGVAGLEHAVGEKWKILTEYFYNGGAEAHNPLFLSSYAVSSRVMTIKRHLYGLGVGYELTPLVRWDNYMIYDFVGGSVFYNPEISYNMRKNFDLTVGAQIFGTDAQDSEFGRYNNVYYAGSKYYF